MIAGSVTFLIRPLNIKTSCTVLIIRRIPFNCIGMARFAPGRSDGHRIRRDSTSPYTTHPKNHNASINLLYYYDLAAKTETKVDLT